MAIAAVTHDPERVRAGVERWLRDRWPDAEGVTVTGVERPLGGLSSDTLLVDVTVRERGADRPEPLVVRLPPAGDAAFPAYDLALQGRVQESVARAGIPTAPVVGVEDDEGYVGAPFLVMRRVEGRGLPDDPPYFQTGWLHGSTAEEQARLFDEFLRALAAVHRLDWTVDGLDQAARPQGAGLAGELAWWSGYLQWATDGEPPDGLVAAIEWLATHQPRPEPPASLLWGDVRLGNVLWGPDLRPAAVLDWEMVSVGPAEVDLAWFLALRPRQPELPGFPERAAVEARYAELLGRELADLRWYEVFALTRSSSVVARLRQTLIRRGRTDDWMVQVDPVPPRLRRLLQQS